MGLDSLAVTEQFFQKLAAINDTLQHTTILPWLSIFTPYNNAMRTLQRADFGLGFLLDGMALCQKYFDPQLLANDSGSTGEGYARGLF
jgi:hypothetical protein